jgi:hypothetical protein
VRDQRLAERLLQRRVRLEQRQERLPDEALRARAKQASAAGFA